MSVVDEFVELLVYERTFHYPLHLLETLHRRNNTNIPFKLFREKFHLIQSLSGPFVAVEHFRFKVKVLIKDNLKLIQSGIISSLRPLYLQLVLVQLRCELSVMAVDLGLPLQVLLL